MAKLIGHICNLSYLTPQKFRICSANEGTNLVEIIKNVNVCFSDSCVKAWISKMRTCINQSVNDVPNHLSSYLASLRHSVGSLDPYLVRVN
jgi:hypothetical protein